LTNTPQQTLSRIVLPRPAEQLLNQLPSVCDGPFHDGLDCCRGTWWQKFLGFDPVKRRSAFQFKISLELFQTVLLGAQLFLKRHQITSEGFEFECGFVDATFSVRQLFEELFVSVLTKLC
jgi:hypothetical protein